MITDKDPDRNMADSTRQSAMKVAERSQLMVVVNERAKLAKDEVRAMAADRLVELNRQLEANWRDQDLGIEEDLRQMQKLVQKVNERIHARHDQLGTLSELRPKMSAGIANAYVGKDRRAQLRQMLKDRNDADIKRAHHAIDVWKTQTREQLVLDGLTSEAAVEFLNSLPAASQLLPTVDVKALAARQLQMGSRRQ